VDQGAVSSAACTAELPSLVAAIDAGEIGVKPSPAPLEDVERVWLRSEVPGARTVRRSALNESPCWCPQTAARAGELGSFATPAD
jgi:hypothetical protein